MKNFILLIIICLASPHSVSSQTLHAIIFANTKSPGDPNKPGSVGIGPSVTVDFERMGIEMTSIASFIGYRLKKYYYYDTPARFSKGSLLSVLNNLSCKENDIVFFYYSGHGLRAENESSQYPEMVLHVPYDGATPNDLYPLYKVYQTIKGKNPRLAIVFGDLCNSTIKGYYSEYGSSRGATTKSVEACDIYKNLFLNVKGGVIAASSKPGHTSGCYTYKDGTEGGGTFTASFLDCLGYFVSQGKELNWNSLLENARELTKHRSYPDEYGEKQTPVFSTKDLVKAEAPATPPAPSPSSSQPTANDTQTSSQDNLAGALSTIGNDQNSHKERIKAIQPTLSQYFANSQARVQVVGRDSKTIVNTTTASSYLNYLSIATKMEQVMVLEEKKGNNGKIVYLKVHEMHRE